MAKSSDLQELVRAYYDKRADEEWYRQERHPIEFAVSKRILEAHLPPSGRVLDCGGGPGRYSLWLAAQGYAVTLFDLSIACLERAQAEAAMEGVDLTCECGTATDLARFDDASFDAVLLMGPLYHLRDATERRLALKEATRVLRPGGMLAAAFITRTAVLRYVAKEQPASVLELYQSLLDVITDGFSETFPPHDADHFHAYFAHPDEVGPLLAGVGLELSGLFAVEGFSSLILEGAALSEGELKAWVDLIYRLAPDSSLFSAADHLLAIARKP